MVSIVLPIYNGEKYMRRSIDSVLAQTYPDWELLLIDDGSADGGGRICDGYAAEDGRVRVFHKPNGGVSSARNLGFSEAKGQFLVCIDSDDFVEPDYLSELLAARERHPEAGHIWCGFYTISDYAGSGRAPHVSNPEARFSIYDRDEIMTLHRLWLDASPCNKLYDVEAIRAHGLRMDEGLSLGEDLVFNFDYLDRVPSTEIAVVNRPLYHYVRSDRESLDNRYRPDLLEIYEKMNRHVEALLIKWRVPDDQMTLFYDSWFYCYEKVLGNTFHEKNTATRREKLAYNVGVLRSAGFREVFKKRGCRLHPMYKLAYALGSYRLVLTADRLVRLKKALRKG